MDILEQALSVMRAGFDSVNAVQGLIIAAVAALIMPGWNRLPTLVAAATLVHVIVDTLLPVVAGGAGLRLPDILALAFWREVAFLLVGYLIVITVFFLLRRLLLRR
jgi:hypothetical protein